MSVQHIITEIDNIISHLEQKLFDDIKTDESAAQCKFKYLVVLDFEATCDKDKKAFKPIEIIEWPAIIIDIEKQIIYKDKKDYFHFYTKPTAHPQLTSFCTELTKITQTMVNDGITIQKALNSWNKWCYDNDLLPNDISSPKACVVTCGDWDLQTMWTKQSRFSSFEQKAMLFSSWINVKKLYNKAFNTKNKEGMMGMLKGLNIEHIGTHHSGIDDVKNICNVCIALLKKDKSLFNDYTTHSSKKMKRSMKNDVEYKIRMDEFYTNK
eukprot:151615_1